MTALARIVLTSGEPAGIGPDLALAVTQRAWPCELVIVADAQLLATRAAQLGLQVKFRDYRSDTPQPHVSGTITLLPLTTNAAVTPGTLDVANASYVLKMLDRACDGCLSGEFAAMVTAPVQKSVINQAGIPFSGHTEYLAERCNTKLPVMMLTAGQLRVALATTHLPLSKVSSAINPLMLTDTLRVLHHDLRQRFAIAAPRILVLGLNPHAGESGYLGREEINVIAPVLANLRAEGMALMGPLPADTAFTPHRLAQADAVLAMYHDQGLPVLKYAGFGNAVNVTLGLPIVRTSVDHGTALELAGSGQADSGSLLAALELAITLSAVQHS